jgi:hypothetical protein
MYNLYFVLHAVEMRRYFRPCNSNYMLCERLLAALYEGLDVGLLKSVNGKKFGILTVNL